MEYFAILILTLVITLVLEKKFSVHLYHNLRERLTVVGIFLLFGIIWDSFAIARGHWIFPQGKTLGIVIGLMPLEEYLFIIIVPYFVLTVYKILDSKFVRRKRR